MEVGNPGHAEQENAPRGQTMTREEGLLLGVLVVVGLGIRLYAGTLQRMPEFDATYYVNYFRIPGWNWVFPPGYPAAIEAARLFISDGVVAARVVSALWGALLAIPLYLVARHYVPMLWAFAAAFLVELNPLMIRQSAMAQSEMQYVTLVLVGFLLYLQRRRVLSGIAFGLAYLTRPEALVIFGILWLYDAMRERRITALARFLAGLLLISLPYVGYLRVSTGQWTLSPKTMNIRERGRSIPQILKMESLQYRDPSFTERLEDGLELYPHRLSLYAWMLLKYAGIAACALALAGLARRSSPLLAGLAMLIVLPIFGLKVEERFIVPYLPFIILLAVITLAWIPRPRLAVAAFAVTALAVVPTAGFIIAPEDVGGFEYIEAGAAMRQLTSPGDLYLDRKPFVAFFAGGSFSTLPNDSVAAVLRYAHAVRAKYLVLSERVVRLFRPQLGELVRNDTLLDRLGLVTVYRKGLGSGYGVRIVTLGE